MASTTTTHRALLITSHSSAPNVVSRLTGEPTPGTALIRMLAVPVLSYAREIYPPSNSRNYPYPLPIVPGSGGIGRVEAPPPDSAIALKAGQLVLLSSYVRGREDPRATPQARYLLGTHQGFAPGGKALMEHGCRDGGFAELVHAPTENVFVLDEARLLGTPEQGGLGLNEAQIAAGLPRMAVPYGGFRSVGLQPGESVAIAPATGMFGGAAVALALSMGARVIAMGRSLDKLERVKQLGAKLGKSSQLHTVQVTGNVDADAASVRAAAGLGGLDVFFEISPPAAAAGGVTPTYLTSGILALRTGGRVALMGGIQGDVAIPYSRVMHGDIAIHGKWMYEPDDVRDLVKMVEAGTLSLDWVDIVGRFPLDQWAEAFENAAARSGGAEATVIEPQV